MNPIVIAPIKRVIWVSSLFEILDRTHPACAASQVRFADTLIRPRVGHEVQQCIWIGRRDNLRHDPGKRQFAPLYRLVIEHSRMDMSLNRRLGTNRAQKSLGPLWNLPPSYPHQQREALLAHAVCRKGKPVAHRWHRLREWTKCGGLEKARPDHAGSFGQ